MLKLVCKITIENSAGKTVSFDYVNSIEVKTSCRNLTDTAEVRIPRKMEWEQKPITNFIARDDKITVEAGYKEHGLQTIFKGYLNEVENGFPIVLRCENEMRLLKTITVKAEKIEKFNIKDFFSRYAPSIEVIIPGELSFGSMDIVEDMPMSRALDEIMKVYPYLKGFFLDGKFYATMLTVPFAERKAIAFSPERNMISDNLTYTRSDEVKVSIKAVSILRDNTQIVEFAMANERDREGTEQRQFFCPWCTDKESVRAYAEKMLAEFKTDRMTGSFKAFGVPFVRKGDIVQLNDSYRPERNGKKFVAEAVDYSFGTSGYRQNITLGDQIHG
ncbi:MAG: hypothetical protein LBU62_09835 [Bacteroidales bacterium]|jgi:hypothetical protein|nr:hypothetical protein [Bacteroidales bacterium]